MARPAVNQTPRSLDLAAKSGALMVALSREGELLTADLADQPLHPGDVVYLIGELTAVGEAAKILGSHI